MTAALHARADAAERAANRMLNAAARYSGKAEFFRLNHDARVFAASRRENIATRADPKLMLRAVLLRTAARAIEAGELRTRNLMGVAA